MTPIVSTLAVTPGETTYQLSVTVPNGSRGFLLEAFDNTGTLRYRGDASMILAGGTASVTIQMSATVTFSQTDLAGDWDGVFFRAGNSPGWHWERVACTISGSGGITGTMQLDSTGDNTLPAPGSILWTISAAGVVSEGGSGGDASFHGQMSSNKLLIIGTSNGSGNSAELRVFRKRTGTVFTSADLANNTFTLHTLNSGTDNTWEYGAGTIDGSGQVTLTSKVNPSGPTSPGTAGTLSVSSSGIVTESINSTFYGVMTDDKKVIFVIDSTGSGSSYGFTVITFTGQTYTQSDYAGIYNFSVIRNNLTTPGWAYGVSSIDAAGAGTYLSYTDSVGGATPAGFTRVLSASGVVTVPEDATAHGQMSYNKDITVRTNTNATTGRYGITIGFKAAGTASGTVSAPAFSPAPGTYTSAQSVTLSTSTPGATIRYTTDGSTPTSTTGTVYAGPIAVSATTTIRAIAYLAGWADSAVASGAYTITPVGATYSISGTVSGAISSGVTITVTGTATAAATTAANGSYSVTGLPDGSYTVTPSMAGYAFAPSSSAATVSGANSTGKDFVATAVLGTYSASGAGGDWNPATGVISWTWTSSTFPCNGPDVGATFETGVTVTSTTMTWPYSGMTWSRPGGTANDIVGTWTSSDSVGNSYTLTINADGTFSMVGVIVLCTNYSYFAQAQHWSSGYYYVIPQYDDSPKTATSVTVTGPGITGTMALGYNTLYGTWDAWTSPGTPVNFGTTSPAGLPFTYTFTITDTTTWTATATVTCFQEQFATNLSPAGTVTGTPAFSWTGINDSMASYGIELHDSNNIQIWNTYGISGTSVVYNGPALTSGATYSYFVQVMNSSACNGDSSSFASGSFTYQ